MYHCTTTHPGRPVPVNTLHFYEMSSELYDPETDRRQCYNARFDRLDSITDADMDGIAVGLTSEPWSHVEYSLQTNGSRCHRRHLFAYVQTLACELSWIQD